MLDLYWETLVSSCVEERVFRLDRLDTGDSNNGNNRQFDMHTLLDRNNMVHESKRYHLKIALLKKLGVF